MKKFDLSKIMKTAWKTYNTLKTMIGAISFAEALRRAWKSAKAEIAENADRETKGIVRMHYAEYKRNYSDCETVDGSYDKRTKTIEVMTKIVKADKRTAYTRIERFGSSFGICRKCGTYCYGDCAF